MMIPVIVQYHALACGFGSINTWFLGFPDRAEKKINNSLAIARGADSKALDELVHTRAMAFFSLPCERERAREHAW